MDLKTLAETPPWEWPRNAGKTFRRILTDRNASEADRLIAAELAGEFTVINDDLAEVLMAVVRNSAEPEQIRARAAISFGAALEQAYTFEFDDPDEVPITEEMFRNIQDSLQKLYSDPSNPKEVRRRILEASVRAPEPWHQEAIRDAYASGDREWMLTAVFAMRYVRGFDEQILAALKNTDPEIHCEAVQAAGNWSLDGAWTHVVKLVNSPNTPKPLLLAAIEAVGSIRAAEAPQVLLDLTESEDEEIAEAAQDATDMAMGETASEEEEAEEEEEEDDD